MCVLHSLSYYTGRDPTKQPELRPSMRRGGVGEFGLLWAHNKEPIGVYQGPFCRKMRARESLLGPMRQSSGTCNGRDSRPVNRPPPLNAPKTPLEIVMPVF